MKQILDILTIFICILAGAPLPVIALNIFGTSYEAPWVSVSAISIALLQWIVLGTIIYLYINPKYTLILTCCLIPFYLNLIYISIKT